jgi:hypothetical protein
MIRQNISCRIPIITALFLTVSPPAYSVCKLTTLTVNGSSVQAGAFTVTLGEADDPVKPTAWQGPVRTGQCNFDLAIIEGPLAIGAGRYLFVPTYSGALRELTVVDLKTCSTKWASKSFVGDLLVGPTSVQLDTQIFALDPNCVPIPKALKEK